MTDKAQRTANDSDRTAPVVGAAVSEDNPTGRLLTRGPAAAMLNTSVSKLRRMEKTVLRPVIIDGVRYHREQDLRDYLLRTRAAESADAAAGAIAGAAFDVFDAGFGPVEVVRRLKITPLAARALHRDWADLGGGFVVGGQAAAKLERIPWLSGMFPLTSGDQLIAMLAECAPGACSLCASNKSPPQFCGLCVVKRPHAIQRLFEQRELEREARRGAAEARALARETAELAEQNAAQKAPGGGK